MQRKIDINNKDNGHDHGKYLRLLSRGRLTVPSLVLTDFILQSSSILHYISPTIHDLEKKTKISENTFQQSCHFLCVNQEESAVRFSVRTCINIFYNKEQKITNQSARKDQIKDFKKRLTKND